MFAIADSKTCKSYGIVDRAGAGSGRQGIGREYHAKSRRLSSRLTR